MDQVMPTPAEEKNLGGVDFFLLWAGAAVSLAEIWAGGMLAGLGFGLGVLAILLGHLIGNTPMALGSIMGAREGLPSMVITRPALGLKGSYLAAILNIVQLIGWTGVMLYLGGQAAAALAKPAGAHSAALWTVVLGLGTTLWAAAGARHWRYLHRISITALLLLCLAMSYLIWQRMGAGAWAKPAGGGLGFGLGLDLVIAMPISWLPLVADYARFGSGGRRAAQGTWWGYFLISSWMYVLGLTAALATGSATPEAMILDLMAQSGWLVPALAVVVLSTFTTTFLDVYSTAVSNLNLPWGLRERPAALIAGGLGTILALSFPAQAYEPFLLYIGAFFCPLFGVVLADYFLVRKGRLPSNWPQDWTASGLVKGFNWAGMFSWALGFAAYQAGQKMGWPVGSSLPSFLGAGMIYWALMKMR